MPRRSKATVAQPQTLPLTDLRARIDSLDRKLVDTINERSRLVVEVGKHKQRNNIPIYAPHREAQVLKRVLSHNKGPLLPRTVEAIYREIMSGSFALERPLSIGYLGPAGSYSHLAAVRQFGSSVAFENLHEIKGVFTEVARGHVDYGLVPIENSIHGGVTESLDSFMHSYGKVTICAEVQLEVHHALLANCPPRAVKKIYSKPEVFSQCRAWLATQYPKAELIPTPSSSKAVQQVAQAKGTAARSSAAIGSTLAAQLYDVKILFEAIEDEPNNLTRFAVISKHPALRSGDDKTSVMFATLNKPGALARVLTDFDKAGVNLTHIDKRPSGRTNWAYTFFIDAEGHQTDDGVARALSAARKHCKELHVLGSYPRSRRIL